MERLTLPWRFWLEDDGRLTDAELRLEEDGLLTDAELRPEDDDLPTEEERDGPEDLEGEAERDAPPPEELRLTEDDEREPPPPLDCAKEVSGTSARANANDAASVILIILFIIAVN